MRKFFLSGLCGILLLGNFFIDQPSFAAVDFDGVDDRITITSHADFDGTTGTVCFWLNADAFGDLDSVMSRHSSTSSFSGIHFFVEFSNINFQIKDASGSVFYKNFGTLVNTGEWHHYCAVFVPSGSTARTYKDGVQTQAATVSAAWSFGANDIIIGDSIDTYWDEADGKISEVYWFADELTAVEVEILAKSKVKGIGKQFDNLKMYLPLDDRPDGTSADLDTASDASGNSHPGNPDNGANNTGLTWSAEAVLSYP